MCTSGNNKIAELLSDSGELTPSQDDVPGSSVESGDDVEPEPASKRRRSSRNQAPSWTYAHIIDSDAAHRRCRYCTVTFGQGMSTGTIGKHLYNAHGISEN